MSDQRDRTIPTFVPEFLSLPNEANQSPPLLQMAFWDEGKGKGGHFTHTYIALINTCTVSTLMHLHTYINQITVICCISQFQQMHLTNIVVLILQRIPNVHSASKTLILSKPNT